MKKRKHTSQTSELLIRFTDLSTDMIKLLDKIEDSPLTKEEKDSITKAYSLLDLHASISLDQIESKTVVPS
jgi:hypothetical protein